MSEDGGNVDTNNDEKHESQNMSDIMQKISGDLKLVHLQLLKHIDRLEKDLRAKDDECQKLQTKKYITQD